MRNQSYDQHERRRFRRLEVVRGLWRDRDHATGPARYFEAFSPMA